LPQSYKQLSSLVAHDIKIRLIIDTSKNITLFMFPS
jgi:hypothetical protein